MAGYRVFYREEGQNYDFDFPDWEGTETTCTIYGLFDNVTYYFVAKAYDIYGNESENSIELLKAGGAPTSYLCEGDINGDGFVNFADLAQLKANFFTDCSTLPPGTECAGDINNDGFVNFGDLALMKQDFFRVDCP